MLIPNTFGLKAEVRELIEFGSVEQLKTILAAHRGEPVRVIGQGSNLLFSADFDGLILRSGMKRVLSLNEDDEYVYIDCGAGIVLDELIEQVVDMRLYGLECLSYIPGTVGASAVQNVGAYGVEAKDVIAAVHTVEIATGEERIWTNEECQFGYRDSVFKNEAKGRYVVTSVTYRLSKKPIDNPDCRIKASSLAEMREQIIATRREKLPEVSEYGSAGSFFKNPVVECAVAEALKAQYPEMPMYMGQGTGDMVKLSAAWLIDHAGLKGCQIGGARVWDKQPLVIVNYTGEATAADILALAEHVVSEVKTQFGVTLSPEVENI